MHRVIREDPAGPIARRTDEDELPGGRRGAEQASGIVALDQASRGDAAGKITAGVDLTVGADELGIAAVDIGTPTLDLAIESHTARMVATGRYLSEASSWRIRLTRIAFVGPLIVTPADGMILLINGAGVHAARADLLELTLRDGSLAFPVDSPAFEMADAVECAGVSIAGADLDGRDAGIQGDGVFIAGAATAVGDESELVLAGLIQRCDQLVHSRANENLIDVPRQTAGQPGDVGLADEWHADRRLGGSTDDLMDGR